ncbi:hypothetical protein JOC86_002387 [Bacillus pakistanensis]|uniref:Uncharacterized protein n=1 Tax=Rossellomorea pakistanensis TaxID=992288 RepID=A0ABS2NDB6_9BACI|nr:hypothetical protein [Bacillus pakistanensis]MBM7585845.1 hypothetical protein [Bacillus pakistanensis]
MPYIDKTYYDETYGGVPIADVDAFSRLSKKASDIIDQITNYSLTGVEFTQLAQFLQDQVKKATSAQVEYMVSMGGDTATHGGGYASVGVGNFSYSEGDSTSKLNREQQRTSPAVIEYLKPTGLLYRGVNTHDSSYSC